MAKRIEYDYDKAEQYYTLDEVSEFGRSRREIRCPFCAAEFWGFIWSLAGGGKKCPGCGALHTRSVALPVKK